MLITYQKTWTKTKTKVKVEKLSDNTEHRWSQTELRPLRLPTESEIKEL